ncbi:MAG: hypothetical protein NVSMB55_10330 [Mycobacteriales bacterium]
MPNLSPVNTTASETRTAATVGFATGSDAPAGNSASAAGTIKDAETVTARTRRRMPALFAPDDEGPATDPSPMYKVYGTAWSPTRPIGWHCSVP